MLTELRGMFAFFIYDRRDDSFFVARDHVGIIPLYIGWGDDGSVWISSEMKVRCLAICFMVDARLYRWSCLRQAG